MYHPSNSRQSSRQARKPAAVAVAFVLILVLLLWAAGSSAPASQKASSSSSSSAFVVDPDRTYGTTDGAMLDPNWGVGPPVLRLAPSPPMYKDVDHLILVPGHAVFTGTDGTRWHDEDKWALEPFQRGQDGLLIKVFSVHIKKSLQLLSEDQRRSIVVFSGGQSRPGAGPRSEGFSYHMIAQAEDFFGFFQTETSKADAAQRVFAEEFARDSYENTIFSIARFREVTGRYPTRISIVGWEYKRERFTKLHRVAIRYPSAHFRYIGIDVDDAVEALASDPVHGINTAKIKLRKFSDKKTYELDKTDPYLCRVNREIRFKRNPQRRVMPYPISCPEIRALLLYCGPEMFNYRNLPWGSLYAADAEMDTFPPADLNAAGHTD